MAVITQSRPGCGVAKTCNRRLCLLALVAAGGGQAAYGQTGYTVTRVVDSTGQFSGGFSLGGGPLIGSPGTVVFTANLAAGGSGLFQSVNGIVSTIASTTPSGGSYQSVGNAGNVVVNGLGQVSFAAATASGATGVFRYDGGSVTTIASSPGTINQANDGGLRTSINGQGVVVFSQASPAGAGTYPSVFAGSGSTLTTVAQGSASVYYTGPVGINNSGAVAYAGVNQGTGATTIFQQSGGTTATVATAGSLISSGGSIGSLQPLALNSDTGAVYFTGTRAGDSQPSVFRSTNGTITSVVGPATSSATDGNTFSVNAGDVVAFYGSFSGGGGGGIGIHLVNTSTGVFTRGIEQFDILDGSTITSLAFSRDGLNDAGQLVFAATLADGRSGVYVLMPVPEPSAALLVCGVVLSVVARRGRRVAEPGAAADGPSEPGPLLS